MNYSNRQWSYRWLAGKGSLLLLGGLILLLAWLGNTKTGRVFMHSGLLVVDLLLPTDGSLLHRVTQPPVSEVVVIPVSDGEVKAQYFRPAGDGPHGALILVLGYPSNIEDMQLNRLAENLARLGIAVLVPPIAGVAYRKAGAG